MIISLDKSIMELLRPGSVTDDLRRDFIAFFSVANRPYAMDFSRVMRILDLGEGVDVGEFKMLKLIDVLEVKDVREPRSTEALDRQSNDLSDEKIKDSFCQGSAFMLEAGDSQIGLVIDAVTGMKARSKMNEFEFPRLIKGKAALVFSGFLHEGEELVPIINAEAIINEFAPLLAE